MARLWVSPDNFFHFPCHKIPLPEGQQCGKRPRADPVRPRRDSPWRTSQKASGFAAYSADSSSPAEAAGGLRRAGATSAAKAGKATPASRRGNPSRQHHPPVRPGRARFVRRRVKARRAALRPAPSDFSPLPPPAAYFLFGAQVQLDDGFLQPEQTPALISRPHLEHGEHPQTWHMMHSFSGPYCSNTILSGFAPNRRSAAPTSSTMAGGPQT